MGENVFKNCYYDCKNYVNNTQVKAHIGQPLKKPTEFRKSGYIKI